MEKSKTPTILITGATGNIGTELIKILAAQKVPFRAMVRKAEDAKQLTDLKGVEAVVDVVRFSDTQNSLCSFICF